MLLHLLSMTAACGSDAESHPASSEGSTSEGASGGGSGPLSGTIDDFPFVVAYARATFQQQGRLWVTLRNDAVDCDGEPPVGEGRRLEVDITLPPATQAPGLYELAPAFSIDDTHPSVGAAWYLKQPDGTIQQSGIGLGPDDGSLTIDTFGPTSVSGHLTANSKGTHQVHIGGTFEAPICAPPDAGADGG